MRKFIVYTLQILAILSAMVLFACVCYIAIVPDVSDVPEWLSKMNTINFFVEPVLCVIALVALGDMKKTERKKNARMYIKGDGNYQLLDFPAEGPHEANGSAFVGTTKEENENNGK